MPWRSVIAFHYVIERHAVGAILFESACRLRIFGSFRKFELENFRIVYDHDMMPYSNEPVSVRRCGIQFRNVTLTQKADLERIILAGCHKG